MAGTKTTITDGVESKVRVTSWIEIFDFFFVVGYVGFSYMFASSFVHESLRIPFYIFSFLVAVFLTTKSAFNKKRRNYESLYFLITKDIRTYRPFLAKKEG